MVWDITTPLGTEALSNGDDRIRELKEDIQTALRGDDADGTEAKFPGADPSNPVFRYRGLKGTNAARPAAGQYGLYFDTTRNALQRDNGSSWEDIATVIPAGTVMLFYQAAAPTGWTQVITQDDKVIRVVAGTGGGTGGTNPLSTAVHTHTISSDGAHTHVLATTTSETSINTALTSALRVGIDANLGDATTLIAPLAGGGGTLNRKSATTNSNGAHTHGGATGSGAIDLAYVDVILASKD